MKGVVTEVRLQRVKRDVEHAAGAPLVSTATLQHESHVAAAPHSQRVVPVWDFDEDVSILFGDIAWKVDQRNGRTGRERDRSFEHALELPHVAGPLERREGLYGRL